MRKLINSTYITLDGVIENPMWTMPYFDEEAAAFAGEQTDGADALLMGRATYDGMSAAWPALDESDPNTGAAYFNNVKKYVASTTLNDPTWNNTEVLPGRPGRGGHEAQGPGRQGHPAVRLRLGHRPAHQGRAWSTRSGSGSTRSSRAAPASPRAERRHGDVRADRHPGHQERRDHRLLPAEGAA